MKPANKPLRSFLTYWAMGLSGFLVAWSSIAASHDVFWLWGLLFGGAVFLGIAGMKAIKDRIRSSEYHESLLLDNEEIRQRLQNAGIDPDQTVNGKRPALIERLLDLTEQREALENTSKRDDSVAVHTKD